MDPERWHRIENLYHSALKVAADERTVFLKHECKDDEELRREVESLLSYEDSAVNFIESPALAVAAKLVAGDNSREVSGPVAGALVSQRFRIIEKLGGGGMGVVYKAEDTKLRRMVALKFLPAELSRDQQSLERFQREAYAASALNHPNICTVHDVDEYQNQPFIAMELLEGQTLEGLIAGKPLDTSEILDLAVQICNGLEVAHARGIVHRDIKPSNIFVTARGQCKILDFGLAKLQESEAADEGQVTPPPPRSNEGELSSLNLTRTGIAIGTAGYMSPEQIRGEKLDVRTDVFSFGLVLYEMATGRRAFAGDTGPALHAAILEQNHIPARELNPAVPVRLERVISKALEKSRDQRYQTVSEVRAELTIIQGEIVRRSWRSRWIQAAGIVSVALLVAVTFWYARRQPISSEALPNIKLTQLTANSPENQVASASISPDGKILAYIDAMGMHVKTIGTDEVRSIALPSIKASWEIMTYSWFPDSQRFFANAHPATEADYQWSSTESSVWLFSVQGDPPRKLRDKAVAWAVSPDGRSIAVSTNPGNVGDREIWLVDPDGGQPHKLFDMGDGFESAFYFFPDRKRVFYVANHETRIVPVVRDLTGGPEVNIDYDISKIGDAMWLPDGRLFFSDPCNIMRDDTPCNYWVEKPDLTTGKIIEKPRQLTNWVGYYLAGPYGVTSDGKKVAFLRGTYRFASYVADLQSDGTSLVNAKRITFEENGEDSVADWTPDSKTMILTRNRESHYGLYKRSLNSSSLEPILTSQTGAVGPAHLSPDGKWVIFREWPAGGDDTIRTMVKFLRVPVTGGTPQLIFSMRNGSFSSCARAPSTKCVVAEESADRQTMVVSAFDPVKGLGAELARFDVTPDANIGTRVEHSLRCDISPDGTRLAIARSSFGSIEIHSLRGQPTLIVPVKGVNKLWNLRWVANGKGLFVWTAPNNGNSELFHVDLKGRTHSLWSCHGGACFARPSPDGRHLAILDPQQTKNVWMMENF